MGAESKGRPECSSGEFAPRQSRESARMSIAMRQASGPSACGREAGSMPAERRNCATSKETVRHINRRPPLEQAKACDTKVQEPLKEPCEGPSRGEPRRVDLIRYEDSQRWRTRPRT